MAIRVFSRKDDDEEEEDDDDEGFDEDFMKQMNALKQACLMHAESQPGGEVKLKSSNLLSASFEEEEEEGDEEDDDALLLSIERRFLKKDGLLSRPVSVPDQPRGVVRETFVPSTPPCEDRDEGEHLQGFADKEKNRSKTITSCPASSVQNTVARTFGESSSDEDEDLLRSIQESCGALDLIKAREQPTSSPSKVEQEFIPETVHEDVEYDDCRRIQPEKDDPSSSKAHIVSALQSFLPAQLNEDNEWDESPSQSIFGKNSDPSDHTKREQSKVRVPENVQAVAAALVKNRLCQQKLRDVLRQVEMKLQENKEMQKRLNTLTEFEKACKRKFNGFTEVANASVELIATRPSRKKTGEFKVKGPPNNPDVETFRTLQSQLPAEFHVKKWTKKEIQALAKGVRQQLQEIRLRALMEGWTSDEEECDFDEQVKIIGEQEPAPEDLKKGLPLVDWNEVARIYVKGRTPSQCRMQWENNEDPLVNFRPWTKVEDKNLLAIVQAHDMVEWYVISKELGTRRTPAQCFIRFQRSLNATILRSAWTPEEDEQLQAAVERFGEKDWQSVAACMEGRLGSQCMARWGKVLHPDRHRRGRWLAEEDTRLKWAVSVYGPRGWKNIAAHVPGRSDVQCRERWCNVLDPSLKIDDWTPEEDAKLEELVDKYGRHRWAAVGSELGRTDNQCFRHWKLLHQKHKLTFKKDMAIRRAAFSANFVGREKERPDLGLQDFLPPSDIGETLMIDEPIKDARAKKSKSRGAAPQKALTVKVNRKVNRKGASAIVGREKELPDLELQDFLPPSDIGETLMIDAPVKKSKPRGAAPQKALTVKVNRKVKGKGASAIFSWEKEPPDLGGQGFLPPSDIGETLMIDEPIKDAPAKKSKPPGASPQKALTVKVNRKVKGKGASASVSQEKELPDLGLQGFLPPSDIGETLMIDEPIKDAPAKKSKPPGASPQKACTVKVNRSVKGKGASAQQEPVILKPRPVRKKRKSTWLCNEYIGEDTDADTHTLDMMNLSVSGKSWSSERQEMAARKEDVSEVEQVSDGLLQLEQRDAAENREAHVTVETVAQDSNIIVYKRRQKKLEVPDLGTNATEVDRLISRSRNQVLKVQKRANKKRKAPESTLLCNEYIGEDTEADTRILDVNLGVSGESRSSERQEMAARKEDVCEVEQVADGWLQFEQRDAAENREAHVTVEAVAQDSNIIVYKRRQKKPKLPDLDTNATEVDRLISPGRN